MIKEYLKQRPWASGLLIGLSATFLSVVFDFFAHGLWYDGDWMHWAYEQGDSAYAIWQRLFFQSVYAITGVIVGSISGLGSTSLKRCLICFLSGPVLMAVYWFFAPYDNSSDSMSTSAPVALTSFLISAFVCAMLQLRRHYSCKKNQTRAADSVAEQIGVWPPPPKF